jgi:two-component system, NarL family, nitrate/nitrite response regulator NarL
MGSKKVFVVGAKPARKRLKGFLATSAFKPIGGSTTLAEAHSSLCNVHGEAERADILLVDIRDRLDDDEAEMLCAIRGNQPATKIIVLGDLPLLALLRQAYPTGIDGYLLPAMPPDMLMHALDLVMSGQQILPPRSRAARPTPRGTPKVPIAADAAIDLSAREAQILRQFVDGSSSKAIARDLAISHKTVITNIRELIRKLRAFNRTRAALGGIAHRLVRSTVVGRPACVHRGLPPDRRR